MAFDAEVKLGADTGALESGMKSAAGVVKDSFANMTGSMQGAVAVGTTLGTVIGTVLVGAIANLGRAISGSINDTEQFYFQHQKLGRALGITADQAAGLNEALDNIHATTEEYTGATKGLERQLKTNEAALTKMGLATRDVNGNFRPLNDLMMDSIDIVNRHKEGTDRNIAAQQMFGRGIADGSNLLALNKQAVEDAIKSNEELGLVIGERGAANAEEFKGAMKDLNDVFEAAKKVVGDILIPILTEFAKSIRENAPNAIAVLKMALSSLGTAFWALTLPIKLVMDVVKAVISSMITGFKTVAEVLQAIANRDFAAIPAIVGRQFTAMKDTSKRAMDEMVRDTQNTVQQIGDLWSKDSPAKRSASGGGMAADTSKGGSGASSADTGVDNVKKFAMARLTIERERIEQMRALDQISDQERAARLIALVNKEYQIESQAINKLMALHRGETDRIAALRGQRTELVNKHSLDVLKIQNEVEKQGYQHGKQLTELSIADTQRAGLAKLNSERASAAQLLALNQLSNENHVAQTLQFIDREYEINLAALQAKMQLYARDPQEVARIKSEIITLEQKSSDSKMAIYYAEATRRHALNVEIESSERDHIQRMADLEMQGRMQTTELKRDMGLITGEQLLQIEKDLNQQMYQVQRESLEKWRDLETTKEAEKKKINDRILQLDRQHANQQNGINNNIVREQFKIWQSLGNQLEQLWGKGIQAMLNGTLTWKNATKGILMQLSQWFLTDVVGNMVKRWIMGEAAQTAASQAGATARVGVRMMEGAQSALASAGGIIKTIMNYAAQAFAGVWASLSGVPIVGPGMAAAAAPAAFSTVAGMAGIVSAAGGYDIPKGVNPMVQAHQSEMILPAKYADVIRGMSEQGASGAGAKDVVFNISAIDGDSVRKFFSRHKASLVSSIKEATRNGVQLNTRMGRL